MNRTKIEYGTHAWNPVTGCSYGCPWGCWAETCFERWEALRKQHGAPSFRTPMIHYDRLEEPWRKEKSARVLVSFMGDLFGPEIPDNFIADVFNASRVSPHHRFFFLTKRPGRWKHMNFDKFKNAFIGVTVTTQAEADERIPLLLATPAAKRWVSIEPMLGEIRFNHHWLGACSAEDGHEDHGWLDFVVCGSIDRPSAQWPAPKREWIESIREQCQSAGVPLWEKNNLARHGIVKDRPLVQELPS